MLGQVGTCQILRFLGDVKICESHGDQTPTVTSLGCLTRQRVLPSRLLRLQRLHFGETTGSLKIHAWQLKNDPYITPKRNLACIHKTRSQRCHVFINELAHYGHADLGWRLICRIAVDEPHFMWRPARGYQNIPQTSSEQWAGSVVCKSQALL